jgi:hypothetical protein
MTVTHHAYAVQRLLCSNACGTLCSIAFSNSVCQVLGPGIQLRLKPLCPLPRAMVRLTTGLRLTQLVQQGDALLLQGLDALCCSCSGSF